MVEKRKRYEYRAPSYNPLTGMYEGENGRYFSYSDATKEQWKCDKCDKLFQNFKLLRDHKAGSHSH